MNPVQYAIKLAYDATQMKDISGYEKYERFFEEHQDFTKTYPLVVKYFCMHGLFNPALFQELDSKRETKRMRIEEGLEEQCLYIKKLLKLAGHSSIQAKKISNMELGQAQSQLNKIKKEANQLKKKYAGEKKDAERELRKEFLDFILNLEN
jgi:hypothetical protein